MNIIHFADKRNEGADYECA